METMYFTFGVLTMIAMMLVGAVVYGIVKVFKQEKQIKYIQEDFQNTVRNSQQEMSWFRNDINDRFRDTHQLIANYNKDASDSANAYTDSRIDKLEAKLTGKSEAQIQLNNKNLIKG